LAQIEHADRGFSSLAADRRCHLLQRLRVAAGEQEIAALIGKSQGDAAADAAARTGHERDLSFQSKLHSQLLVLAQRRTHFGAGAYGIAEEGNEEGAACRRSLVPARAGDPVAPGFPLSRAERSHWRDCRNLIGRSAISCPDR